MKKRETKYESSLQQYPVAIHDFNLVEVSTSTKAAQGHHIQHFKQAKKI